MGHGRVLSLILGVMGPIMRFAAEKLYNLTCILHNYSDYHVENRLPKGKVGGKGVVEGGGSYHNIQVMGERWRLGLR